MNYLCTQVGRSDLRRADCGRAAMDHGGARDVATAALAAAAAGAAAAGGIIMAAAAAAIVL